MEIITSCDQQSPEWFQLRLGSIGGKGINSVAADGKGASPSIERKKYLYAKASELLTGVPHSDKKFQYADRGTENEPLAIEEYELLNPDADIQIISMIKDGPHKHYSADLLIGSSGIGEVKTRLPHIFLAALEGASRPTADKRQVQWGLQRSQREWCDYIQFCPEWNGKRIFVQRIYRDEREIKGLEEKADQFIDEMLNMYERYKVQHG